MLGYDNLKSMAETVRGLIVASGGGLRFTDSSLIERLRDESVKLFAGETLGEASKWSRIMLEEAYRAVSLVRARGVIFPKELRSFISNPPHHLSKKLFQYSIDLARSKMSVEEYMAKAKSAIATSLRTNMRSIYQYWVFLGLVSTLAERGAYMVYPEHGYIHIERAGRQRGGSIPANLVLRLPGKGEASFYIEAPRPVGWGDTRDLRKVWSLYVSLRPDMIIYKGRVVDMVDHDSAAAGGPPVKKPNLIVECKELRDWYERTRYLKGSLAKPLTAEEWYSRWWSGLVEGLGDILGVEAKAGVARRERSIKVKEYRLVLLYKEVYKPEELVLVSRSRLPWHVKKDLEDNGVTVVDGLEIGWRDGLNELASIVERYFGGEQGDPLESVEAKLRSMGISFDRVRLLEALAELADAHIEELARLLSKRGS